MALQEPPSTMTLRWCDKCGRDDRFAQLKDRHFANGKLCEGGTVRTTIYVPKDEAVS